MERMVDAKLAKCPNVLPMLSDDLIALVLRYLVNSGWFPSAASASACSKRWWDVSTGRQWGPYVWGDIHLQPMNMAHARAMANSRYLMLYCRHLRVTETSNEPKHTAFAAAPIPLGMHQLSVLIVSERSQAHAFVAWIESSRLPNLIDLGITMEVSGSDRDCDGGLHLLRRSGLALRRLRINLGGSGFERSGDYVDIINTYVPPESFGTLEFLKFAVRGGSVEIAVEDVRLPKLKGLDLSVGRIVSRGPGRRADLPALTDLRVFEMYLPDETHAGAFEDAFAGMPGLRRLSSNRVPSNFPASLEDLHLDHSCRELPADFAPPPSVCFDFGRYIVKKLLPSFDFISRMTNGTNFVAMMAKCSALGSKVYVANLSEELTGIGAWCGASMREGAEVRPGFFISFESLEETRTGMFGKLVSCRRVALEMARPGEKTTK